MNIEEVRKLALSLPGVTEDMPYGSDWLIFRIEGKIFLHIWLESPKPTCAVKLVPAYGQELRETAGVRAAYHLNKVHWNDLLLDEVGDGDARRWIEMSYRLVLSKLPRRLREKYVSS